MSKVLLGPLTDLSALMGFLSLSPQQGVKYQLLYMDFFGGILLIAQENLATDGKVGPTKKKSKYSS
jgi:hypothetical protein